MFTTVSLSSAQNIVDADFISHMHNDMAAVKKGSEWGFIDAKGKLVIDFRNDLVVTSNQNGDYPIFENDRALISQSKDGINYYGYIDTKGKTVVEPQYLNATNFEKNRAIVLLLKRTELSKNPALDKPVVSYDYHEVVIDHNGKVLTYLHTDPTHVPLSASTVRKPPVIHSKLISETLVAVRDSNKKWSVVTLEKE